MNSLESPVQYLKIDDAARMLGVSRRWVYRRIWSGELPASKVGGLYFIQRSDLEDLLDQRQPSREPAAQASVLEQKKCGNCFRLITSDDQLGGKCQAPGCEKLICSQCLAEGVAFCALHAPAKEEKLERMQESLARGEISLLVKASAARLLEINFLNRLQARIERISNLIHPLSNELLSINNWDELRKTGDERTQVMRMLNKVMLDSETLARTPLNTYLAYTLPAPKRLKGSAVRIHLQVISRLAAMLKDGYDTAPLEADDLQPWLARFSETCHKDQVFCMLVLASPTGWGQEARQVIQGKSAGSAFMHRNMLVYLYDLPQGEMIYNAFDERLPAYAELFIPLLPAEQLDEVQQAIQKELVQFTSLPLDYAAQILPYSPALLRQAYERLAASGRFTLSETPEYGLVIVRK